MVRSMYSGVSGMKAHQTRMDVIGNNIANVNTYGYKASRASFRDIYYQTVSGASAATANRGGTNPSQIGYGAQVGSIDVIHTRSSFQMTDNGMDAAIAGEGYFQVQDSDGNIYYTRAGMLSFDAAGNLVDSNGNFVLGVSGNPLGRAASSEKIQITIPPVSPTPASVTETINGVAFTITAANNTKDGNITFNFVADSTIPSGLAAQADITTTGITIRLNPTHRFTDLAALNTAINNAITEANGGVPHPAGNFTISSDTAGLFPAGDDTVTPPIPAGLTGAEIVSKDFSTTPGKMSNFPADGIFGGMKFQTTSTNFSGEGQVSFSAEFDTDVTPNRWIIEANVGGESYIGFITADDTAAGSVVLKNGDEYIQMTHPGFTALTNLYRSENTGQDPTDGESLDNAGVPTTLEATPATPSKALGLSTKSIRLSGGTEGGAQTIADLSSIGIGADGIIEGIHPVHGRLQLGRIDLVTFENPSGLEQEGNTYFSATANSGTAKYAVPGTSGSGALAAGSLEMSNVDLAKEFSDMIVTQRGFQANSRLITVSDEMLNELVNLKR